MSGAVPMDHMRSQRMNLQRPSNTVRRESDAAGIRPLLRVLITVVASLLAGSCQPGPLEPPTEVEKLRKWAEEGDAAAQNNLGVAYATGRGIPQDDVEAAKWYHKAAEQGNADAQFNFGFMYFKGRGVPQDDAEAVRWYREAAKQGHAEAQNFLRVMYLNRRGVPQDDAEAVKWYRKWAEQGDAAAQNSLGLMYTVGLGVPQDPVEAHKWFNLAGYAGNDESRENRDLVALKMTPAQIAEAQKRAREWKPTTPKAP